LQGLNSPSLGRGGFFLPWQKKDGVVFLKHGTKPLKNICSRLTNTTPAVSRPPLLKEGEFRRHFVPPLLLMQGIYIKLDIIGYLYRYLILMS